MPLHLDTNKKRYLNSDDRKVVYFSCKSAMVDGKIPRGVFKRVANSMGSNRSTVSRQWESVSRALAPLLDNHPETAHAQIIAANGHIFDPGFSSRRKGKYKHDRGALRTTIKEVPLQQRRSMRKLSRKLHIPRTSLRRMQAKKKLKEGETGDPSNIFQPTRKSTLKPTLTDMNKLTRLNFCLEQIDTESRHGRASYKFHGQYNKVHLDEKWFFLTRNKETYILLDDEELPDRATKHKSHITKVMFLCAQARPRKDHATGAIWDGKIGMWPIGHYTTALRNSCNRPAGTTEWQNDNVDHESYRELLTNEVFPAILEKWPTNEFQEPGFKILVQQDGAGGHTSADDPEIINWIYEQGLEDQFEVYTQPANSPDLNINDLGLFNALQQAYHDCTPKTSVEIIECVQKTFKDYPWQAVDRLFVTLQSVFNEIIDCGGHNTYKIPHMNKERLQRLGILPRQLDVSPNADGYL
ncbi:transposon protein [Seminavis robusta]|uniref:Transposon protein n=1 Tax=Seminavis robusta TaxID=568900 RepID=A0A9N8F1U7_9STRA|nr:transposon protein [Seminavis robusta]|eukprot:Sro2697_g334980.1 transposon protein (467) ;mRNA; r:8238-9638